MLHFPFYSFYDDAVKFFKTNGEENCVTFEIGVCFGCMVFVVTNICYTGPKLNKTEKFRSVTARYYFAARLFNLK